MNYAKIFSQGLKYVHAAGDNWYRRKDKLVSAWVESEPDYKKRTPKKERISRIIDQLDERTKTLSTMLSEFKEKQARLKSESENEYIMLYCRRLECRCSPDGVGLGVRMKDFEHGKYKCEKCGSPLEGEDDKDIDFMLFELGISPS